MANIKAHPDMCSRYRVEVAQSREQFVELFWRVLRGIFDGQAQPVLRSLLNQWEESFNKGRHPLFMEKMDVHQNSPQINCQLKIFPEQRESVAVQRICLPLSMNR